MIPEFDNMAAFVSHFGRLPHPHGFRPNRMVVPIPLFLALGGRLPGSGKHGRRRTARERRTTRRMRMQRDRRGLRWVPPAVTWADAARSDIADWFLRGQS
jgi:hypothetical protein